MVFEKDEIVEDVVHDTGRFYYILKDEQDAKKSTWKRNIAICFSIIVLILVVVMFAHLFMSPSVQMNENSIKNKIFGEASIGADEAVKPESEKPKDKEGKTTPTPVKVPDNSDCKTITFQKCIFPFKYDGKTYNTCTTDDNWSWNSKPWCATTLDANGYKEDYGFCDMRTCSSTAFISPFLAFILIFATLF